MMGESEHGHKYKALYIKMIRTSYSGGKLAIQYVVFSSHPKIKKYTRARIYNTRDGLRISEIESNHRDLSAGKNMPAARQLANKLYQWLLCARRSFFLLYVRSKSFRDQKYI